MAERAALAPGRVGPTSPGTRMRTLSTTTDWPPDMLSVGDLTNAALERLLELGEQVRTHPADWPEKLRGASVACCFGSRCTTSRVTVEAAAHRLGMTPIHLEAAELRPDEAEELADLAAVAVVGGMDDERLRRTARELELPVVNAVSHEHHPSQALCDLLTLREVAGGLDGLRLAYVGDARTNVARSVMEAGALLAMDVRVACPPDRRPEVEVETRVKVRAELHGGALTVGQDPVAAVTGADAVLTGPWARPVLAGWQVDGRLVRHAKPTAVVLHDRPARHGAEIGTEVLEGRQSAVRRQAANRLPAQAAALYAFAGTRCAAQV